MRILAQTITCSLFMSENEIITMNKKEVNNSNVYT